MRGVSERDDNNKGINKREKRGSQVFEEEGDKRAWIP